jgi:hypothetical protein
VEECSRFSAVRRSPLTRHSADERRAIRRLGGEPILQPSHGIEFRAYTSDKPKDNLQKTGAADAIETSTGLSHTDHRGADRVSAPHGPVSKTPAGATETNSSSAALVIASRASPARSHEPTEESVRTQSARLCCPVCCCVAGRLASADCLDEQRRLSGGLDPVVDAPAVTLHNDDLAELRPCPPGRRDEDG